MVTFSKFSFICVLIFNFCVVFCSYVLHFHTCFDGFLPLGYGEIPTKMTDQDGRRLEIITLFPRFYFAVLKGNRRGSTISILY